MTNYTTTQTLNIAQNIATKICHDLAGVVGAISNGIELIEEDSSMAAEAMEMIKLSADDAAKRLKFLRQLFGSAKVDEIALHELQSRLTEYYNDGKINISLTGPDIIKYKDYQLALNVTYFTANCLIRGGDISINIADNISINASGATVIIKPEVAQGLQGDADNISPYTIQPLITNMLGNAQVNASDSSLQIVAQSA